MNAPTDPILAPLRSPWDASPEWLIEYEAGLVRVGALLCKDLTILNWLHPAAAKVAATTLGELHSPATLNGRDHA